MGRTELTSCGAVSSCPPLLFTDAEAVALTLGLLAIRRLGVQFPVDVAAVEGALAKTERLMPEKLLLQARALQEAITFNALARPAPELRNDFITPLSLAVQECRPVRLRYRSWQAEESERDFDPYGIVFNDGFWYTAGFCHLRQDLRTFRLDRIQALESSEGSFTRPADFDVLGYVLDWVAAGPGFEQIEVLLQTSLEHARELILVEMGRLEEVEGGVLFRRSATQLEWVAHILIQADFPVKVIRTEGLKDLIRRLGTNALRIVGEDEGMVPE